MLTQIVKPLNRRKGEVLVLLVVLSIAVFFRFFQLANIPPEMLGDESVSAWGAIRVLADKEYPVFFPEDNGRLPMQMYLEAVSFHLFGVGLFTSRAVSAVTGVVTVVLLYLLVKRLFAAGRQNGALLALLSSVLLATSYWHLVYSRFAADPILLPFFVTAVTLLLCRAVESRRSVDFVWAGLLLGLSAYSYPPAALLPLLVLSFLSLRALVDRGRFRVYLLNTAVLLVVTAIVVLPLACYAFTHPDVFFARSRQVSILNPEHNEGSPLRAFLTSTAKTMGMFSLVGDPDWARNPAERPILDPMTSAIFLAGLVVAVRRYREPPYLFVVLWLIVMSLPGSFTAKEIPNYNRTVGAVPAVCILVAIGIEACWVRFKAWRGSLQAQYLFWLGVAALFLWTATLTFRDFFNTWEPSAKLQPLFVETSEVMNQLDTPHAVWILPVNPIGSPCATNPTIEYLHRGQTPHWYVNLEQRTVAKDLATICNGRAKALLLDWTPYAPVEARFSAFGDPKRIVPFLLGKYGRKLQELSFANVYVLIYQLPAQPSFSIADDFEPANVRFGRDLRLVAVAMGGSSQNPTSTPEEVNSPELPSGRNGWVVLRWKAESVPSQDYKVGVYLVDQRGRRVAQADKVLLSNYWEPSGQWEPGQEEIDYYTLPSLPGTPPGWYDIQIALYDEETMERLPVLNEMGKTVAQTATVGRLQVVTPLLPAVVQPAQTIAVAQASVAPDITLLGYDIPTTTLHPGDTLSVALYWKALRSVRGDYVLTVQLNDQHGRVWAEERGRPVYGTYPTTEWAPDEVLRDWHDLTLQPSIPGGSYQLELQVKEAGQVLGEISLGSVEVEGRAHLFEVPEMQHSLGIRLGEQVTLLGYDLSADQIQAGDTLALTLYWQAVTEMESSYTVFTHLLDGEGRIWGQKDAVPGGGQLPTTSWVEGEIIEDGYEIEVSRDAPAGEYALEVGMYQWETGERLPVSDEYGTPQGDRILLDQVQSLP